MEMEESFTNKLNEIINDKKELYDKVKEYESTIKSLNNKISEQSMQYEHKIDQEKSNSQNTIDDYESHIKKLNYELEKAQKKSYEQNMRINKLLEEKSVLQNELYKLKEFLTQQKKEKEDLELVINNLEKEKNNLIQDKENLIKEMNHIDSRIKSKGPKTTDISNKFQNIGQSSMSMIRTNIGLDSGRKKIQTNNVINSGNKEIKNTNWESARKSGTSSGNKNNISINSSEKKDKEKEIQSARININNNK